jgi:hypothetical protein
MLLLAKTLDLPDFRIASGLVQIFLQISETQE